MLKNEDSKDIDKKSEIEGLISRINNEFFSDLLLNARLLTDYNPEVDEQYERYEEELRVPVLFDDDAASDESVDDAVMEEGEEESGDEQQATNIKYMDIEDTYDQ